MNETNNNYWTKVSALATAIAALFSGVAMLIATSQFKTSLTESRTQFEKSLSKTDSSIVIAREQFEFSKKQSEEAVKEAVEQNKLQKLQFEKQLNELRKQSNASIKQIDYQIKAQRPYLSPDISGFIRASTKPDSFRVAIVFRNSGFRPAQNFNFSIIKIDSSIKKIIKKPNAFISDFSLMQNMKITFHTDIGFTLYSNTNIAPCYFSFLAIYKDAITKEKYIQEFMFRWKGVKQGKIDVKEEGEMTINPFEYCDLKEEVKIRDLLKSQ